MAIVLDGSNGITYPVTAGSSSALQASSSKVIQVVQTSTGSTYSVNSTSFTATGITCSITPQFATSKILVSISGGQWRYVPTALQEAWAQMYRSIGGGSYSALGQTGGAAGGSGDIHEIFISPANNVIAISHSLIYLDSPGTTSTVTYQPYAKSNSGPITVYYNLASPILLMTLMEIAA